jgi:hypothetical protein
VSEVKVREDRRAIQREVFKGELFELVRDATNAMRSGSEYDIGPTNENERRFAVLCWAAQECTTFTLAGTITITGMKTALLRLSERARAGK